MEQALERVEHFGAVAQCLAEAGRAHGQDQELLHVHLVVGVGAAVDHVHHRHWHQRGSFARKVAIERLARIGRRCVGRRQRDREDRVRTEARLGRSAVQLDHPLIDSRLVGRVVPLQRATDLIADVFDRLSYPFAAVAPGVAVAQLDCLARSGRSAGRNRRHATHAGIKHDFRSHRRVAARIENFVAADILDLGHCDSSDMLR